jgi:hypothetical protein
VTLATGYLKYNGSVFSFDDSTFLTRNQTITLSGDITGSGTTAITTTYNGTVPINKGGTNATSANAGLNNLLPSQTSNANKYLQTDGTNTSWATVGGGGGGTVTSVALTMPSGLTVGGSPITTSGTLAVTTTLNGVIHGDGSGFNAANVNLASEVTGTLPVANGGTGVTTLTAGSVVFVGSGPVLAQDNSNFYWDNTNKGLLIGGGSLLTGSPLQLTGNANNSTQANVQNLSSGGSASSDWIATANNGNNSQLYIDMGINSSGYNDPQYTITGANAGYLYTNGGNIVIGTQTAHDIIFHTDSTLSTNERWRIAHTTGTLTGTQRALGTTSTDGLVLTNTTAATVGTTVQISPRLRFVTNAWKSNSVADSQETDFILEALGVTGTAATTGTFKISSNNNGAGYNNRFQIESNGIVTIPGTFAVTNLGAGLPTTSSTGTFLANAIVAGNVGYATSTSVFNVSNNTLTYTDAAGMLIATATNSNTNTTLDVLTLRSNSSGTPAANYGVGVLYKGKSSTTGSRDMARISAIWSDATDATRTAALTFNGVYNAAANAEYMRLVGTSSTAALLTLGVAGTTKGSIAFSGNTSGTVTISPAAAAGTYTLALPTAQGSANQTWINDGSGNMSFATLPVAGGGTGATTLTNHGVLLGQGTSAIVATSAGTAGQVLVSGGASADPSFKTPASYKATPADPTGTSSTSAVMMGLAGSITPTTTGNIEIIIVGAGTTTSSASGGKVQIRYGTGSAPANGDAATGTTAGSLIPFLTSDGAVLTFDIQPFTCIYQVTGLTVSTAYWIDLGLQRAFGGGTASVSGISISVREF